MCEKQNLKKFKREQRRIIFITSGRVQEDFLKQTQSERTRKVKTGKFDSFKIKTLCLAKDILSTRRRNYRAEDICKIYTQ